MPKASHSLIPSNLPKMTIHVDESPVGTGKTQRAIDRAHRLPARWLFAVERLDGIDELSARISAAGTLSSSRPGLRLIKSDSGLRGHSVRQEVEALPEQYAQGHVIVLCTHAALLMSDLSSFAGWNVVIDEVPNVLQTQEVRSKLDVQFFRDNYTLEHVHKEWSVVSLTDRGRLITGSDLQQDDSHRHLRIFHQRVADSTRGSRAVVCNLGDWTEMEGRDVQWVWWSLFSIRELEAFATVTFLGNGFSNSLSATILAQWDPDVVWSTASSLGSRPLVSKKVHIQYFSENRRSSKTWFESERGRKALSAIGSRIANDAPQISLFGRATTRLHPL